MPKARGVRPNTDVVNPAAALEAINKAIDIRKEIAALYGEYGVVAKAQSGLTGFHPRTFKRAVDATYYLGGGWPSPGSPGRMEAFLDNFTELYRFMEFIGKANLIEEHLAENGISVKLKASAKLKDRKLTPVEIEAANAMLRLKKVKLKFTTLRELASACHRHANGLQGDICGLADQVNDGLKPAAMDHLKLAPPEYARLFGVASARRKTAEAAGKRMKTYGVSLTGYAAGLEELKKPAPKT